MRALLLRLRQLFCRHSWRVTLFQALTPGTSFRCERCGLMHTTYDGERP